MAYGVVSVSQESWSLLDITAGSGTVKMMNKSCQHLHRKSHFYFCREAVFTLESVLNLAPYEKNRTHTLAVGSDSRNLKRLESSQESS